MVSTIASNDVPHLVDRQHVERFDVLGPTVEYLTPLLPNDFSPCLMRGHIPSGVVVPLHTHADPESFVVISGEIEGLIQADPVVTWVRIKPGDVFHVPGGTKHAFRNQSKEPAVMYLFTTSKIGRFFQEVGTRLSPGTQSPGPPSGGALQRFLETSERYGYWNATPEENARIGISLPAA